MMIGVNSWIWRRYRACRLPPTGSRSGSKISPPAVPGQFATQFDQRQRVSASLGNDPLAYSAVNAAGTADASN